tara:strand:+ start:6407 stop:6637 length:231 start_codon:yes stop_codon:yes gene_type:complete
MNLLKGSVLIIFLIILLPDMAFACATCFGAPDAPATLGMNWAIITLLGVTGAVLGGIIKSIISIKKKTNNIKKLHS